MHKLSRAAILALHAVYSREPRGTANYPVSPSFAADTSGRARNGHEEHRAIYHAPTRPTLFRISDSDANGTRTRSSVRMEATFIYRSFHVKR